MGQDQRTTTRQRPWKSSTEILASSRFPKMLPDSTCSHSPSQWIPLTSIPGHQSTSLKRMATRSLGQVYILTLDCLILWQEKLPSTTRFQVQTPSLKLEADDAIGVRQTRKTDIPDCHVSFCGTLIHLEKASASPGGCWADPTNVMEFPTATEAPITTIDDTPSPLVELNLSNIQETKVD